MKIEVKNNTVEIEIVEHKYSKNYNSIVQKISFLRMESLPNSPVDQLI